MRPHTTREAYELIRTHTAKGDHREAERVYRESPITFARYQAAQQDGLRDSQAQMAQAEAARSVTRIEQP